METRQTDDLRLLVACRGCQRQYDASNHPAGSHFRCACGDRVAVPEVDVHDAAVVRCSSCGGTRLDTRPNCSYCGSDFTLHERDLHTVCPQCMARISDRARFCHYCATPIAVQGSAGDQTDQDCPDCVDSQKLKSRSLGDPPVSIRECGACGGLWLENMVFQLLEERAVSAASSGDTLLHRRLRGQPATQSDPHGRYYRSCPVCGTLMHRRNYGKRSGVLIDLCGEHGVWFDMEELDRIIHWVKAGGLGDAQKWEQQRKSAQQQLNTMMDNMRKSQEQWKSGSREPASVSGSFLDGILDYLL